MKYEASDQEQKDLLEMSIEDAFNSILKYENVFEHENEMDQYRENNIGPSFFVQKVKSGTRLGADFNQNRIRMFETNESDNNFRMGFG